MKNQDKTKAQLINELMELRHRTAELEKLEPDHKGMEEALKTSELRFRRLFETAQDGILILNADTGMIEEVNSFLIDMLGYSHEEFLGKRLWEIGFFKDTDTSKRAFEELQNKKYIRYEDIPLETKDGRRTEVEFVSNVYKVDGKKVIQCNVRDITGRKVSKALREEKDRTQQYLDIAEAIIVVIAADQTVTLINKKGTEVLGYSTKEIIGKNWYDTFIPERLREQIKSVAAELIAGKIGPVKYFENPVLTKGGEERIIAWYNTIVRDGAGQILATLSSGEDITERKRAEEALRSERKKLEMVTQNMGAGLALISKDYRTFWANNVLKQIFGDVEGKPCYSIYNQGTEICPKCGVREVFEKGIEKVVHEQVGKDIEGNTIWSEIIATPVKDQDGNITGALELVIPITERKQMEEILRESESRYRSLFDGMPIGVYRTTAAGEIIDANPALIEMLGYLDWESLSKVKVADTYIDPEERKGWQPLMEQEGIVRNFQKQLRHHDGTVIWVEENARAVRDAEGRVLFYEGSFQDITERKRAEESLRESGEKLKELFDEAPVGYHEMDAEGRITQVNRTELEMLGYRREEVIGQPVWNFIVEGEESRQAVAAKLAGVVSHPKAFERTYRRKDGTTFPVIIKDRLLRDREGRITGIRSTLQDITDRKRADQEMAALQDQLRQSQKMESIGRLAGGIAHDFNNLLTIIKGYSQLSLIELKEGDPLRENLDEVRRATDRATDLIRQLLAFGRRQVMEMRVLDLNTTLRDIEKMLRRVIGEDIELITVLAGDLGRVKADPGQIEQVIMNLAVNARDAMPSGGKLVIETANVELDKAYARRHVAVPPGHYVMLAVSDTGVGMTLEVRDQVFEPFFTTKEKGKGTGLGLSTVYGIVKQSGGNIWVYSEPGQGTTFKIYLPRVDEPLEEVGERVVKEELPRGRETILVVEDEGEVRRLAVKILRGQGYKVLEASNGTDTLMICKEQKEPIDLILTDVVMPKMNGRQLVEQVRQMYQNFKVLYMSGYTDNIIVHHGILEKGMNYIQKPFAIEGLARKVREVLDK